MFHQEHNYHDAVLARYVLALVKPSRIEERCVAIVFTFLDASPLAGSFGLSEPIRLSSTPIALEISFLDAWLTPSHTAPLNMNWVVIDPLSNLIATSLNM